MNSLSHVHRLPRHATDSTGREESRGPGKAGATGVYLKGSPELSYALGISSTQMATARIRCSNGDIYNESIS